MDQEQVDNQDTLECSKCGQNVEQILALQCDHNLCLQCASKTAAGHCPRGENLNYIKCEICGANTILDPSSTQILDLQSYHQSPDHVQYGTYEGSQEELAPDPQMREMQNFSQQKSGFVPCRDHPSEQALLYCFNCETPCICVECCLQGLHKGHDLKNVHKNYDALAPSVEDLRFKIKTRTDHLINDETRLTQKKRDIIELVNSSKQHIKQSFQDLHDMIDQKQNELLQNCEEQVQEKFQLLDRNINQIKQYTTYLNQFEQNLTDLFYQNASRGYSEQRMAQEEIKAYNFYADNKMRICQQLRDMDINFFQQVQAQVQVDYSLDMQSLYQHLDSIRSVKLEIMTLKGVESSLPSNFEQQNYEKLLQERNKRKFSTFGARHHTPGGGYLEESPERLRDVTMERNSDYNNYSNLSKLSPSNQKGQIDYRKAYEDKIKRKIEENNFSRNLHNEIEKTTHQRIQELRKLM